MVDKKVLLGQRFIRFCYCGIPEWHYIQYIGITNKVVDMLNGSPLFDASFEAPSSLTIEQLLLSDLRPAETEDELNFQPYDSEAV